MQIHEFVDEGLGHSSYLVVVDGSALVVEPRRSPRRRPGRVVWVAR